jgi:RsiW-degrading membrane proteinase PrsW (M82 family)
MPILTCDCGARLNAPDTLAGKLVQCPKCTSPVRVPAAAAVPAEPEIDLMPLAPPSAAPAVAPPRVASPLPRRPVAPRPPPAPPAPTWKLYGRWILALALLPLFFSVFTKSDVKERFEQMIESDPKLAAKIEALEKRNAKDEELFAVMPENRIPGAFVSHSSKIHWLFAILSAGVFWGFLMLVYPLGNSSPHGLWGVGVFTGTVGIVLLLGLQIAGEFSQGMDLTGRSIIVILFYIVKFIGFSYRAALDPENGFLLSMLGFTFGVGFCEEVCKLLPLLWHFKRTAKLDLSGAVLWGLASGIGFGVSEGITYSADQYNGIHTGEIYGVRFVSCVALHAIWNGFSAVLLWKWQNDLQAIDKWYDWFIPLFKIAGVSMVLHALYDTALKKDHELVALVTAVVSFAAFFWLYERVKKDEPALTGASA